MEETFTAHLKELGVTDAAVATLVEQELTKPEQLASFTYEQYVTMGIKAGSARILADNYGPKTVAPVVASTTAATPGGPPMNITVRTGNPEDMTVRELLQAVADGERSTDFTSVLRRKVRNMRIFVRLEDSDKLDVPGTMELMENDFDPGEEPAFWGSQPTETLTEILEVRKYADPLTGEQLAKGDPWLKLGEEQMAMAAYARIKNILKGSEDKYQIVTEAQTVPPADRWARVRNVFTRGVNSHDPLVMEARAQIYYTRKERGTDRRPISKDTKTEPNSDDFKHY